MLKPAAIIAVCAVALGAGVYFFVPAKERAPELAPTPVAQAKPADVAPTAPPPVVQAKPADEPAPIAKAPPPVAM
ncbi:MAG: murein L,D-transpeptidase, partial [Pseudolabrys sp.]|nr:murein L,D-transpeptidase [Pseudolabrys sp.]